MVGELKNNDTISEDKISDAEYITQLESEIDVKLAKIEADKVVWLGLILIVGLNCIIYTIAKYGSN